jgi:hypothetical protein
MLQLRTLLFTALVTTMVATAATAQVSTDNAFQVRYASNIPPQGSTATPDSVINITNTGANGGVTNLSGNAASLGGSICVNVYGFSSDEQMVGCCSCPVTPNALVSLSVAQDIATNTLTPRRPTSLVIKLVSTVPVGGTCVGSAAGVNTATLAPGLAAWGTTPHSTGALATAPYAITETAFTSATLSASEQAHLGNVCSFIIGTGSGNGTGSGFGLCASCRLGGLGAAASAK